jgi:CSLREA domain-containing protein
MSPRFAALSSTRRPATRLLNSRRTAFVLLAVAVALAIFGVWNARALTLTVNDLGDTPDSNPGNGVCADANNRCTLRAAMQETNASAGADTINFNVTGTIQLTGILPEITQGLTINGPGAAQLTVRRNTGGEYRIFTVNSPSAVSISGLTITNGSGGTTINIVGNNLTKFTVTGGGGGVANNGSGNLTISNCFITRNSADAFPPSTVNGLPVTTNISLSGTGGGVANTGSGSLLITNSTVSNNTTGGGGGGSGGSLGNFGGTGGGIANTGEGNLTVEGSTVNNNTTGGGGIGGGIANTGIGSLTVTNTTVKDNSTGATFNGFTLGTGGGIANTSSGDMTLTNATLEGNATGGVSNTGTGTVFITGSKVNSSKGGLNLANTLASSVSTSFSSFGINIAAATAGGITNSGAGLMSITNTTVSNNENGGINNSGNGTINVTNCTVNNTTANFGAFSSFTNFGISLGGNGGINNTGAGIVSVVNSNVNSNAGGGINNSGSGNMSVTGSTLNANAGGGIANMGAGTINVSGTTVSNSTGGASTLGLLTALSGTNLSSSFSKLLGNLTISPGGGIANSGTGTVNVAGSDVKGNSGSGINNTGTGTMTLVNTSITGNSAASSATGAGSIFASLNFNVGSGGGVANTGTGTVTLTNCTVSDNKAGLDSGSGGGIYNGSTGTVNLMSCSVNNNTAGIGGNSNSPFAGISSFFSIFASNFPSNNPLDSIFIGFFSSGGGGIANKGAGTVNVTNTFVNGNSAPNGAGIYNSGTGTVNLTSVVVGGNKEASAGGGINNSGKGTVNLINSNVASNTVAIKPLPTSNPLSSAFSQLPTLINSLSQYANSPNIQPGQLSLLQGLAGLAYSMGGGIANNGGGTVTLLNSTVTQNTADIGGGISSAAQNSSGKLVITNSVVSFNKANKGGGIHNKGTLNMTDSTVSSNSAPSIVQQVYVLPANFNNVLPPGSSLETKTVLAQGVGGGINHEGGPATIKTSTINGNSAGNAGGGFNNGALLALTNSTISGNTATKLGGGISSTAGVLVISSSTIVNNLAGQAGPGILGNVQTLFSSIIAQNILTSINIENNFAASTVNSQGFNVIGSTGGATITPNTGDRLNQSAAQINLGPLANNGGPTLTHALLSGSVASDNGNSGSLMTDQRGALRIIDIPGVANAGDGSDTGAYEAGGTVFVVNNTGDAPDINLGDGICDTDPGTPGSQCSLRAAIVEAHATAGTNSINFNIPFSDPGYDPNANRYTLHLLSELPSISKTMAINGPGSKQLFVRRSAGGDYRIFTVNAQQAVSISGMTILNGQTPNGVDGGGIHNTSPLTLRDVVVDTNQTGAGGRGGGIFNVGTLTLIDSTILVNRTGMGTGNGAGGGTAGSGGNGGGIYNQSQLTIRNSTITGNETGSGGIATGNNGRGGDGGDGAGIFNAGTATINNSTISGNLTGVGGLATGQDGHGGDAGDAGGIGNTGTLTLTNSTVIANETGTGGTGAASSGRQGHGGGSANLGAGSTSIGNSIVAANVVPVPAANDTPDVFGSHTSLGYNFIGVNDGQFNQTGDQAGSLATPLDPQLGPLADNGGPTMTHAVLPSSPVIDKGNSFGTTTDQRGSPRPNDLADFPNAGNGADIGAFEVQENLSIPRVASIVRLSGNPAAANTSVLYTVTFTEPVTGVDQADFTLTTLGLNGASITSVVGSNETYTVGINTGTPDGSTGLTGALRLDVLDNDSIKDSTNIPLGGASAGNGDFTGGETYQVLAADTISSLEVNTTADTDDGACTALGTGNGCTLREAIRAANKDTGAETITFNIPAGDAGCVGGNCTISLTGALPDITDHLNIQGTGVSALTVRRNTGGNYRIFNIGASLTVEISGMTITNGRTNDNALRAEDGGGIQNQGTLRLTNVAVKGNQTGVGLAGTSFGGVGGVGGGLANFGTLVLENSTVSGNQTGAGGNATANGGIGGNGGSGGGVFNSGVLLVMNSTISGNQTGAGGNATDVDGVGGGGGAGGAIFSSAGLAIINSTISNNKTGKGGDANAANGNGGPGGDGGGIYQNGALTTNSIDNSTIASNETGVGGTGTAANGSQGHGGGSANLGTGQVNIRNSIIAANLVPVPSASDTPDVYGGGQISAGHNLIGVQDGQFNQTGDQAGSLATPLDPQLGPLADNGGPTETRLLLPGSPAINAGDNSAVANPPLPGPPFKDQRGFERIINTTVDIGAVEVNYTITATGGTPQFAFPNTAFALALEATVKESGKAVGGIPVTFTAPGSGASGTFAGGLTTVTVNTDVNGVATAPQFSANGVGGNYNVVASLGTGLPAANFVMTNTMQDQFIIFNVIPDKAFGDADFNISATASSGLTVSLTAAGSCTVTGNTVHLTGAGSCTITAKQGGNGAFNPAPDLMQTFSIGKANQTISFGPLPGRNVGDSFNVNATASSTLPVIFSIVSGPATIIGNTVTTNGAGTVVVRASQPGDNNFNAAAPPIDQSFIVKSNQTLTFAALADMKFGEPDQTLNATASSGLAVTFTATGNCTVSGNFVHPTGPGPCTVTASQAGDATFNQAVSVSRSFNIARAISGTVVSTSLNPSELGQSVTFTATILSTGGIPTGTVQFAIDGTNAGAPVTLDASGVATFATSNLTAGNHPITATYNGDASFEASNGTVDQQVNVQPSVSINDIQVTEGNSGTTNAVFTVTLSQASNLSVAIDFTTANGTATAGSDYETGSGKLTFNPGELTKTIEIKVTGDTQTEPNETFFLNLSNAANATIGDNQGLATITDDDDAPTLSINDLSLNEGNAGATAFTFTVQLSAASTQTVTVNYVTANDTAVAPGDYTALPSTPLSFAPGETQKTITVLVNGDNVNEPNETFLVNLSNAVNAAIADSQGVGTILNDDGAAVQFSTDTYSFDEGIGQGVITVERIGDTTQPLTVDYITSDLAALTPCQTNNTGIASDRCDYATAAGILRFAAGEQSKTIQLIVVNDAYMEGAEQLSITLSNPQGGALGPRSVATVIITDNDTQLATTNPIDDLEFFIQQLYIDFLGRRPEPAGLQFWRNRMTTLCPAGQMCDRTDTAVRFFMTDEFRERAYFAYLFYHASLARRPTYREWIMDVSKLNGPQTPAEQMANQEAFINEFMSRPEFLSQYNHFQTAAEYVEALTLRSGVTPASKQQLIDNYNTVGRAKTLRAFIETPEVQAQFFDRGFITFLYFGFLRRDAEPGGFQFWMDKFNQTNRDRRLLVEGFLNSDEYRFRLAQISHRP